MSAPSASGDLFATPETQHSLFFALLPDAATAAAIAAARDALEAGLPPQRGAAVPEARLHMTLHWRGEWSQLPDSAVAAACAAATTVDVPRFHLVLDRAECFGHGETVWVLRPSMPPAGLQALHHGLAQALARQRLRLPSAPAFAPHVSLRRRASARFAARPVPALAWPVHEVALVHSERAAGRTGYRVVGRWPLPRPA